MKKSQNFQEFIYSLCQYWTAQGCIWSQSYDTPMGAGTFHPHTFFKALGPEPWRSVYVQPCRRPVDGRYGKSPNRLQHYYQLQVLLKPAPANILDVYLKSLEHIRINLKQNDVALYEDNWKGPTLGAWGLGWEVRANGEEVTQFTYLQEFGGLPVDVTSCEITYGLERLYMYAYGYQNIMDIPYNENFTYGDIYYQNEAQFSHFNFTHADIKMLFLQFEMCEQKVLELCENKLSFPAYDYVLQASHAFNLLDARGALSVTERQRFLGKVRDCAKKCALVYVEERKENNYPFLKPRAKLKRQSAFKQDVPHLKSALSTYNPTKDFKKEKSVGVLLELGIEEMPPDFQISALRQLKEKISHGNVKFAEKYAYDESFVRAVNAMDIKISFSSRRMTLRSKQVPKNTPMQEIELWGPAEHVAKDAQGNLTQAGLGFCKKNHVRENEILFKQKPLSRDVGVSFLFAKKTIPSCDFPTLLVNEFKNYIYSLDIPLKMRWLPAEISPAFVRPVRWVLCLVENKILPIEMFGLQSSSFTYGQRVLEPAQIQIKNTLEYKDKIKKAQVILCRHDRQNIILKQMSALIKTLGEHAEVSKDIDLLEKCLGMSESPYVFLGKFDTKYLKLPAKLIKSVLKEHMNYFSVHDSHAKTLMPYYMGVANYKCLNLKSMIAGTQKVVTSRLEDGAFYFETDLSVPFQSLRNKLKDQVFQGGLGSLYEKSERLAEFIKYIAYLMNQKTSSVIPRPDRGIQEHFSNHEIEDLEEAGRHCKNDLKTGCVQEFPDEMQGVMGGVLTRAQNAFGNFQKSEHIAQAIEEHYFPLNAHSSLPSSKWAYILALADKFDSLILFLSCGYEPKGNQDPFGVRRLAIAVARLLNVKNEQNDIEFLFSFDEILNVWKTHCVPKTHIIPANIKDFFVDRVKSLFKENFSAQNVEAISKIITHKPLKICVPLLKALEKYLLNTESLIPYKRARSMTHEISEKSINPSLFVSDAEIKLYSVILTTEKNMVQFFENGDFDLFFQELSLVTEPLAQFFDSVLVNDPNLDVRQNRLQLLLKIRKLYENIIDLSVVQVGNQNEKL